MNDPASRPWRNPQNVTLFVVLRARVAERRNLCYNGISKNGKVSALIYAIIAAVALAGLSGWLIWRCLGLREALEKARARNQELHKDRAIRQNLQQVLARREAEIRRLRARVTAYENDVHEMESRTSDLNMSLFKESGLRILAEKEDGVKRMKMEQLEQQLADANRKLREQAEEADARLRDELAKRDAEAAKLEAALRGEIARLGAEAGKSEEALRAEIAGRDDEIARLQQLNARRLARKAQADAGALDQVTIEDIMKS